MISKLRIQRPVRLAWLLSGLVLLLIANLAIADEYHIQNGRFDGYYNPPMPLPNLSPWKHYSYGDRGAAWSPQDANDSPFSGSAKTYDSHKGNNGTGLILHQCVKRNPDAEQVHFGASALVDEEDADGVGARVIVDEHDTSDCSSNNDRHWLTVNEREHEWKHASTSFTPRSDTRSYWVALGIWKKSNAGESGWVYFDNVWLEQEVPPIFDDRFEE